MQAPLRASVGLNLGARLPAGLDRLRSGAGTPPSRAGRRAIVWFDALVTNVDRTARNTNLLVVAQAALPHRPRRGALLPPRLGRVPARAPRAASRRFATTCCCPSPAPRPRRGRRRAGAAAAGRARLREHRRRRARRLAPADGDEPAAARARLREFFVAPPASAARLRRGGGPCPRAARLTTPSCASCRASSAASASTPASSSTAGRVGFLGARIALDHARLAALDPAIDVDEVERALALIPLVCAGDPRRRGRSASCRSPSASTGWSRRAARSSQTSPVHTGLCDRPRGRARAPAAVDGAAAEVNACLL